MPTYEYECTKCGHCFEVFQSMSDEPLKNCVKCGKEVHRLIFGGAGVIFKGSGFYVTDKSAGNAAGKAKNKGKSEAKPPEASGSKGDAVSKGDSRDASKTVDSKTTPKTA